VIPATPAKDETPPLSNRTIAISVSETPDLARLGMLEGEDKVFLGALLTPLIYSGARVAYGGRIEHPGTTNFTLEMSSQLAETYRRQDTAPGERPMIQYLRAADAQSVGSDKLFDHALRLGTHAEIRLLLEDAVVATLLPAGRVVDVRAGVDPPQAAASGAELRAVAGLSAFFSAKVDDGLAALRGAMTRDMDARIIMGGAIARTAQGTSGVIAEALAALDAGKPLLVMGGVGGASRDVAACLGLLEESERVYREPADYIDKDGLPSKDRYDLQLREIELRRLKFEQSIEPLGLGDVLRRLAISESHLEVGSLTLDILARWLH
jgi:SLOG cluster2